MRKKALCFAMTMAAVVLMTACSPSESSKEISKSEISKSVETTQQIETSEETQTLSESNSEKEEGKMEISGENSTGKENQDSGEAVGGVQQITWEYAGELEPQIGSEKNIGTAGLLAGSSNGYIIVGGGANFPEGGPETGGAKKFYPDIYVLKPENGQLVLVNHTALDYEIGYGASITTDDGIYYVGGSPAEGKGDKIIQIKADEQGQIAVTEIGSLPFTFSDGVAVMKDGKVYVGAGKQDGAASNRFYCFDLSNGQTTELEAMPGGGRTQCVAQALGNHIYVFSGGDKVAYTDGYKYNISENTWQQVSDVQIGEEKISLLGAGSVKLGESEMLVIGGFNKEIYDDAVAKMAELKDEALAEFKNSYFGAEPSAFNWNKNVLIYYEDTDTWQSVGEISFDAPCGEGLILNGDSLYSINGEIKPGTRTNKAYVGIIRKGQ